MTTDQVQSIIARIILEQGGPDPTAWMKEHNVDKPTDGDTQKLAYSKEGRDVRLKQRTGRFIRAYLWPEVTDAVLQEIAAKINAALWVSGDANSEYGVKELRGEALRECYRNSGIHSCMAGNASAYLDIYVDNPDKVCLLYVELPDGKARVLCWTLPDGRRYQDRIYYSSESAKEAIKAHAASHEMLAYANNDKLPSIRMKIRDGEKSQWPYADTFRHCKLVSQTECILTSKDDTDYTLGETDGTLSGANTRVCCVCDCSVGGDDSYIHDHEIYCDDCYGERFTCCDICGTDVPSDYIHYIDNLGQQICDDCMEDYDECKSCGNTHKISHMMEHDNDYYCEDCIVKCDLCNETVPDRDTHTVGPNTYCEDCFEEMYDTCGKCGEVLDKGQPCSDCATDEMYAGTVLSLQTENPEHVPGSNAQGQM